MESRQAGAKIGALVGTVGGLVFVLVNAGASKGIWPGSLRGAAIALFVLAVVLVLRADALGTGVEPTKGQMRAYWWVVIAEVAAIPAGSFVLRDLFGLEHASLPWVAIVLGLHFIGFGRIFPGAGFTLLGAVVTAFGSVGLALAIAEADTDAVVLVAGVATGFALLLAVIGGVVLGRRQANMASSGTRSTAPTA